MGQTHLTDTLLSDEEPRYLLNRRLIGPEFRSEPLGKVINFPTAGIGTPERSTGGLDTKFSLLPKFIWYSVFIS
jgi:hypothetical protein